MLLLKKFSSRIIPLVALLISAANVDAQPIKMEKADPKLLGPISPVPPIAQIKMKHLLECSMDPANEFFQFIIRNSTKKTLFKGSEILAESGAVKQHLPLSRDLAPGANWTTNGGQRNAAGQTCLAWTFAKLDTEGARV